MEDREPEKRSILKQKLKVISLGIEIFADDLKRQNVKVVSVDWQPPAGGDEELLRLLEKLGA
ncbi:MAG: fdrA domain protein [Thaumarchaeota archaeon]|nr:MAG: fdrA domain protein [Nitrososphaerota archaeon]TLY17710.1 MAG: fdrA domain protein [Nitrososphaerota archaeon]